MHDRYRPVNRTARTRRIMNQSDCEDALDSELIGLRVALDYYILSPGAELAGTIGVCRRSCALSLCMTDTGQSIGLRGRGGLRTNRTASRACLVCSPIIVSREISPYTPAKPAHPQVSRLKACPPDLLMSA